jgi:two-component system, chemotaxis family, sensor kinase Cph1
MPEPVQTLPARFLATPPKRLLVVEDECLVALMIADLLVELGYNIVGPAFTISEARRLASTGPIDAALIDVNLNGIRSDEVVDILSRRKIPFLFVTGYDSLPTDFRMDADLLKKPFGQDDLQRAIKGVLPACSVDPTPCAGPSEGRRLRARQ